MRMRHEAFGGVFGQANGCEKKDPPFPDGARKREDPCMSCLDAWGLMLRCFRHGGFEGSGQLEISNFFSLSFNGISLME